MATTKEMIHGPTSPAELVLITEEYLCRIAKADFDGRAEAAETLRSLASLFRTPLCLDEDDIRARREVLERRHRKLAEPLAASVDRWRANLPAAMLDLRQWVNWRSEPHNGSEAKVLYCPRTGRPATIDNAETFGTFAEACAAYMRGARYGGIGYVFTSWDDFAGVDFDKCIGDDGTMRPDVAAWVAALDSYTEVSSGGRGIHVILRAALPGGKGRKSAVHGVEAYSQLRCLTMTGDVLLGAPLTVESRQMEVQQLLVELFLAPPLTGELAPAPVMVVVAEPPPEPPPEPLADLPSDHFPPSGRPKAMPGVALRHSPSRTVGAPLRNLGSSVCGSLAGPQIQASSPTSPKGVTDVVFPLVVSAAVLPMAIPQNRFQPTAAN